MKVCAAQWRACIVAVLLLAHATQGLPLTPRPSRRRVVRETELSQSEYLDLATLPELIKQQQQLEEALVFGSELPEQGPRDKRTIKLLLNVLFWKINTLLELKTRVLSNISQRQRLGGRQPATTPATVKEDDDVPEFDSNRVMLDIPGELFGTAFSVITDVSKIIGDVILNTARRTQQFVEALKPAITRTLGYKITALTSASSVSKNGQDGSSTTTESNDI